MPLEQQIPSSDRGSSCPIQILLVSQAMPEIMISACLARYDSAPNLRTKSEFKNSGLEYRQDALECAN